MRERGKRAEGRVKGGEKNGGATCQQVSRQSAWPGH